MTLRPLAVIAATALSLAACSSSPHPSAPKPSPSWDPPADGGTYANPHAVAAAINAHTGLRCSQFTPDDKTMSWPTGTCSDLGSLIVVLPDDEDPASIIEQLSGDKEQSFLRGRNWIISFTGGQGDAAAVRAGLGGTVQAVAAKPSPAPANPNVIPGDGTYVVPSEVKPGVYRSGGGESCYWARLKDLTGEGIAANGLPKGPVTVQILPRDKGFETQGCGGWQRAG